MQILIFRTNIRDKKQVATVGRHIINEQQITKWNIDLNDVDCVLRVETPGLHPKSIESLIQKAGHNCEELPD
ncbi:MAG: hypothetical protein H0W12_06300 [Chitinophagaceae bacterium]|nr:hypothetical protein [Chitinophagaceae bacterium]